MALSKEEKTAKQQKIAATKALHKRIENKVDEIFEQKYWGTVESHRDGGFNVVFRERDLSFEDLKKLSDTFGTNLINMGSEDRDDGYCETCSSPYSVAIVRIDGVSAEWRE